MKRKKKKLDEGIYIKGKGVHYVSKRGLHLLGGASTSSHLGGGLRPSIEKEGRRSNVLCKAGEKNRNS